MCNRPPSWIELRAIGTHGDAIDIISAFRRCDSPVGTFLLPQAKPGSGSLSGKRAHGGTTASPTEYIFVPTSWYRDSLQAGGPLDGGYGNGKAGHQVPGVPEIPGFFVFGRNHGSAAEVAGFRNKKWAVFVSAGGRSNGI